ncbi:MAG: hypothetical protein V4603_09670 [Pseudomonadota bacterium]
MLNRQGWKFVARDALALYVLSYLIRFALRAILGLPEPPSALAELSAGALVLLFGVLSFGVVSFYTRNEVWKHLVAVSAILYVASAVKNVVSLSMQLPEFNLFLVITAITPPLIHYSLVASIGGYLGLKLKHRRNDRRAAS